MEDKRKRICLCCGEDTSKGYVSFHSQGGNYGSTIYDNMDDWNPAGGGGPTYIDAHVCDKCVISKLKEGTIKSFVVESFKSKTYEVDWVPGDGRDLRDPQHLTEVSGTRCDRDEYDENY